MSDTPVADVDPLPDTRRSDEFRGGLREQKKQRTRRAIHRAALEMVLDDGLENVTVERIAETAGISPRTFFNYFPNKDTAILGLSADVAEQYARLFQDRPADEHAWDSVVQSVREGLNRDPDQHKQRMTVLFRYPELLRGMLSIFHDVRDAGQSTLTRRMEAQGIDPDEARRLAVVYINLSSTLMTSAAQLAHQEHIGPDEALDKVLTIVALTG